MARVRIRRRLKDDAWPTVFNVREKLGDSYASDPEDSVIDSFLAKRKAEVQALAGETWATPPELIFKWVLNYACADVLFRDITGKDVGEALSYKVGDLSVDKSKGVALKLQSMDTLKTVADLSFENYLLKQTYYSGGESQIYQRGEP